MRRHLMIALAGAALAAPAAAGTLMTHDAARTGEAVRSGTQHGERSATGEAAVVVAVVKDTMLRYRFPARPGVCGSGDQIWITDDDGGRSYFSPGRQRAGQAAERVCERGPVHAVLRQQDGRITDVTLRVGPAQPGSGWVVLDATAAVDLLLSGSLLQHTDGRASRDLIFAAVLADAPSWPQLLHIARSREAGDDVRKDAIFWLGQAAGDRVVEGLIAVAGADDDDLSVREAAVFSLYRMRDSVGIEPLIDIARTHSQPRIRRSAMFWLGQSGDPRALEFFASVLRG